MDSFFCFFRWAELPAWHPLFQRLYFENDYGTPSVQPAANIVGDNFLARLALHIDHLHENGHAAQDKLTVQAFLALMKQLYSEVYVPGVNVQGVKVNFGVILSKFRVFEPRLQLVPLASALFNQAFKSVHFLSSHTAYNNRADAATFMATFINNSAMDGDDCAILKKYVTFLPAIPSW